MTRLLATLVALVLLLAPASALAADDPVAASLEELIASGELEPGTSLRITYLDPPTGSERTRNVRLSSLSATAITFQVDGQPGRLPATAIVRIERRSSRVLRSAGIGALSGATVLGMLGAAEDDSNFLKPTLGQSLLAGGVIGGALGAVAGLIGSHHTTVLERDRDDIRTGRAPAPAAKAGAFQQTGDASPQEGWEVPIESPRRWRILAWTGALSGASSLEQTLASRGFGDDRECYFFCEGTIDYPTTHSDGRPWGLELGYAISPKMTVAAMTANTRIGRTTGYQDGAGYLEFGRQVRTLAAIAAWTPTRRVRIGAGPALHSLRFEADQGTAEVRTSRRLGLLVDGTVDVVQTRSFLLSLKAQYRYTGSVTVGPFESSGGGLWSATPATFEPVDVSFNHFFIGGAIGFRF